MRKPTKLDLRDERALAELGHPIPERRLARWRAELKLGPLNEDPAGRIEHYRLLDRFLGRGKSATWAALLMAGHGFPTKAYRALLVKVYEVFSADGVATPLPPFGDADQRPDAERYEQIEELAGEATRTNEGRGFFAEDEDLGAAERAFVPLIPMIKESLRRGGSRDPLGDLSLIMEDAMKTMVGWSPSDPNLAPMPDLIVRAMPTKSQPPEETMTAFLLPQIAPLPQELARVARDEPLETLTQAAMYLHELIRTFNPGTLDEHQTRAMAALFAPGLIALLNVLGPAAAGILRKRGLSGGLPEFATEHLST